MASHPIVHWRREQRPVRRTICRDHHGRHAAPTLEERMGWKTLITARAFWVSGHEARAALESAGCEVAQSPEAGPLPEDRLIDLLQDCDAVVASSDPYT